MFQGNRFQKYAALWALLMSGSVLLGGCGGDSAAPAVATNTPTALPSATLTLTATPSAIATASASPTATPSATPSFEPGSCDDPAVRDSEPLCALDEQATPCDFLVPEKCLLPYPSSFFLRTDPATATGFRVNYARDAMPPNAGGVHIDPTEWNTLDGFSPGPIIEALFPQGVDLLASDVATITDFARSLAADSPTVLIDAATGEHVPHFAELDVQASGPSTSAFLIRPGVRLHEATRYIVAIRHLKDRQGNPIVPERAFQILRDNLDTPVDAINARRAHFEDIFGKLAQAGVARDDLILAWDFVTASTDSLTSRALSLRDQGLAANGPGAPPFTVTSVEDDYSDNIFRRVRGTFTVPLFMNSATPPAFYNLDENGMPRQNGTATAPFTVTIPRIAVAGGTPQPGRPVVYGHGLLGSGEGEVTAGNLQTLSNRFDFILAATDWVGMSEADRDPIIGFIADLSNFRGLPDRLQQAMLNFMLLGRLLTATDGFSSDPAFQLDGQPLIDPQQLYYYGISQGGIEGAAYMALSTETIRGVLGVPAANYSILLQRSTDFTEFQFILNLDYPDELDRALLYPLIQQLWDRAEPQGYLSHLVADPLPETPAKKILIQMGVNDSQVPNIGTEIEARSLGIPSLAPAAVSWFQVPEMSAPFDGSAVVAYDVNATTAPLSNTPPAKDNGVHEAIRRLDEAQRQIDAFLRPDGTVQNFCSGPCFFQNVPGVDMR